MVRNGEQSIRKPKKGSTVQFKNFHKQLPAPFIIHEGFEAITETVIGCQPSSNKSDTDKYQKHTGCSYGYKLVCYYDDTYSKPVKIYRGEDSIETFMQQMLSEVQYCQKIIRTKFKKPLVMSEREEQMF